MFQVLGPNNSESIQTNQNFLKLVVKALLHTNILNNVTAAPFSVSFSQLPAVKKKQKKNGAVVTLLRTFVHSSAFNIFESRQIMVRFMSSSSSSCSSLFPFQSSEFGSRSISSRLAQVV